MKRLLIFLCIIFVASSSAFSQERKEEKSANLRQYASGKFGFYFPSDGLNNGLLFGIDGITEFIHHGFILSGAIDLYPKQSIDIFKNPKPNIAQQTMVLLPIHVNFGYLIPADILESAVVIIFTSTMLTTVAAADCLVR